MVEDKDTPVLKTEGVNLQVSFWYSQRIKQALTDRLGDQLVQWRGYWLAEDKVDYNLNDWPIDRMISLFDRVLQCLIDWVRCCLTDRLTDRLIIDRPIDGLTVWLSGCLTDKKIARPIVTLLLYTLITDLLILWIDCWSRGFVADWLVLVTDWWIYWFYGRFCRLLGNMRIFWIWQRFIQTIFMPWPKHTGLKQQE